MNAKTELSEAFPLRRCISLWQPWASLMACGAKTLETRAWDTKVRGLVLIHAAQTKRGIRAVLEGPEWIVRAMELELGIPCRRWEKELPFGALIARGKLVETHPAEKAIMLWPEQAAFGNYAPGRYAHRYAGLNRIIPVPFRGAQGFFFYRGLAKIIC